LSGNYLIPLPIAIGTLLPGEKGCNALIIIALIPPYLEMGKVVAL